MPLTVSTLLQTEERRHLYYQIPADILPLIFSNLPAYKRKGSQSVGLVSRRWAIENRRQNVSIQEIIQSCHTAEDALNILADEALYDQLSFDELLKIASFHPELVKTITSTAHAQDNLMQYLTIDQIAALISKTEEIILQILNLPIYKTKWTPEHLARFSYSNLQAAHLILQDKDFVKKMFPTCFIEIFKKNPTLKVLNFPLVIPKFGPNTEYFTQCFNTIEEVRAYLKDHDISDSLYFTLALKFAELAKAYLTSPKQRLPLSKHMWSVLGCQYDFVAEHLIQNPNLLENAYFEWQSLALKYEFVAKYLVASGKVSEWKLPELVTLLKKYPFFGKAVAATLDTTSKFSARDLHDLGVSHIEIAKTLINNSTLHGKLKRNNFLHSMLSKHKELADEYLTEHPSISLKNKALLCAEFEDLAVVLYQENTTKLCGEALFTLAHKQPKIAEFIEKSPKCIHKLSDIQLLQIGLTHPDAQWALDNLQKIPVTISEKNFKTYSPILKGLADASLKGASFILNNKRFYQYLTSSQTFYIVIKHPRLLLEPNLAFQLITEDILDRYQRIPLRIATQLLLKPLPIKFRTRFNTDSMISKLLHLKAKELVNVSRQAHFVESRDQIRLAR
jgi:hypothetical protein